MYTARLCLPPVTLCLPASHTHKDSLREPALSSEGTLSRARCRFRPITRALSPPRPATRLHSLHRPRHQQEHPRLFNFQQPHSRCMIFQGGHHLSRGSKVVLLPSASLCPRPSAGASIHTRGFLLPVSPGCDGGCIPPHLSLYFASLAHLLLLALPVQCYDM